MINYGHFIVFLFVLIKIQSSSEQHDKTFRDDFVVPHLFPSPPQEICPIVYKPGLIILTGKPYFSYQIKGLPDISWNNKYETYYTIIILGAFQQQNSSSKDPLDLSKINVSPPQDWWHQWVKVNVFENWGRFDGNGFETFFGIKYARETHRVLYAFAVYEQKSKIELNLDDKNNSANELLRRHLTPVANFEKNFPGSVLQAGNYFHVIETVKLEGGIRDDLLDPKALKYQNKPVTREKKPDYRYFGLQ